jgi:hypothetical protein
MVGKSFRNSQRKRNNRKYSKRKYSKRKYSKRKYSKRKVKGRYINKKYSKRKNKKKLVTRGGDATIYLLRREKLERFLNKRSLVIYRHFRSNGSSQMSESLESRPLTLWYQGLQMFDGEPSIYWDRNNMKSLSLTDNKTPNELRNNTDPQAGQIYKPHIVGTPSNLCIFTSPLLRALETTLEVLLTLKQGMNHKPHITIIIGPFSEHRKAYEPFLFSSGNQFNKDKTPKRFINLIQILLPDCDVTVYFIAYTQGVMGLNRWSEPDINVVNATDEDLKNHVLSKGMLNILDQTFKSYTTSSLLNTLVEVLEVPEVKEIMVDCGPNFPILVVSHSTRIRDAFNSPPNPASQKLANGEALVINVPNSEQQHKEEFRGYTFGSGVLKCTKMPPSVANKVRPSVENKVRVLGESVEVG